jgi:syntaxin 7
MQMSYQDFSGSSSQRDPVPAWAQRANEPMLPTLDLAAVKRSVHTDLKELRKAAETLAKLGGAAKKKQQPVGTQLLAISSAARERARATTATLRDALGQVTDGSPEQRALNALSEEFRQVLIKFQQQVEATSHLVGPAGPAASAAGCSAAGVDIEAGGGGGGGWGDSGGAGWGDSAEGAANRELQVQIANNESVIADREQGINQLNRSVQEVAEIFQDLALLVNEQGTQIDNIQTNIETAAVRTSAGVRELGIAARHQRRTRSRMLLICACVLAVILTLVLVLKYGMHKLR